MAYKFIQGRMFHTAEEIRKRPALQYAIAIGTFALAVVLRFAAEPYLPPGFPFLTFFPAVILTGFLAGTRPGVVCAALSTLAAWYWFIVPYDSFHLDYQTAVAILFFVTVIAVDLMILHMMNKALVQLVAEKHYTEQLVDQQKTLFQELQHRVANNLGFVSGLLAIQASRLSENSEEVSALLDARVRLETMSRVHRRLYDPLNVNMCLKTYFEELCNDIALAAGRENVTFRVEAAQVKLEIERVMNLSLIVVEVVTNCLKHAFPDGRAGVINIVLTKVANADGYLLVIRDNGVGFPEGFDPATSKRLGFRILSGFMRALQGEMTHANDGGSVVRVSFPS